MVATSAGKRYKPFRAKVPPRPFARSSGLTKVRTIDNPLALLKSIQSRINSCLLRKITFPYYLCGGIRGRSVLDNVVMQACARFLVTIDIKNFFPSISNLRIYEIWSHLLGCSPPIASLLTSLTTFERHLPQGAPTSTLLANLVLYSIDEPIRKECMEQKIQYSTWVDDLAFSGDNSPVVIPTVFRILRRSGFRVSRKKMQIMGPASSKVMNGVLASRFPNVLRERMHQLRSGIHKLRTGMVPVLEQPKYERSLEGKIRNVSWIYSRKGNKLLREFRAAKTFAKNAASSRITAAGGLAGKTSLD